MKTSKELMKKFKVKPKLKLAYKLPKGGTKGTGPHRVTIKGEQLVNSMDYGTGKEEAHLRYTFMEDNTEKIYDVPVKDQKGDLHYLIQRLSQYEPGTELILECLKAGPRSYISVIEAEDDLEGRYHNTVKVDEKKGALEIVGTKKPKPKKAMPKKDALDEAISKAKNYPKK